MLKIISKIETPISKIILLGWMILLIEGCSQIASTPASEKMSPTESAQPTATEKVSLQMNPSETPATSGIGNLLEMVKADLAQRLSVSKDEINVVETVDVEWTDSSLGCPQSNMSYLQVITPGYRIVLDAGGQQYEYHSNKGTYFVYCEDPDSPILPQP